MPKEAWPKGHWSLHRPKVGNLQKNCLLTVLLKLWPLTSCQNYWFFIENCVLAAIFGVTTAVFWLANAFFLILDVTGVPHYLRKYKIQEDVKVNIGLSSIFVMLRIIIYVFSHLHKAAHSEYLVRRSLDLNNLFCKIFSVKENIESFKLFC